MVTPYMTIEETAKYLKLSEITIYRMVKRKEIPAAKLGRSWRIHRDDLDAQLQGRKSEARLDVSHVMMNALEDEIDNVLSMDDARLKKTV